MPQQDNDLKKGAIEPDKPNQRAQASLKDQLPHRPKDPIIDSRDSDFPEPGENPEHSGQDMNPGLRQKLNQSDKKDDPLAA
jgi:hypothetical protein